MVKIRKNTFETNSSSTHAFVIDNHSDAQTYTEDDLKAFTEVIYPFSTADVYSWSDPQLLIDLSDKVKYFWTVYIYHNLRNADDGAMAFMGKLQNLLPQASFAYRFPYYDKSSSYYTAYTNAGYLEDADYVMNDYYREDITTWTQEELKQFLCKGIIIFGNRDSVDYSGDSVIDNIVDNYQRIITISG